MWQPSFDGQFFPENGKSLLEEKLRKITFLTVMFRFIAYISVSLLWF